jgi:hypothetical protein
VLFLAGMAVYISGNGLVQTLLTAPDHLSTIAANSMVLATGAMLMLMAAAFDAAHGILMLPVLTRYSERLAFGYLGSRIIDAVLLAIGVVFLLLQIPLSREYLNVGSAEAPALQALSAVTLQAHLYAYEIGMIAVGLAGLLLCFAFFRTMLVPRPVAVWGLAGYAILLGGSVLQVLGFDLRLIHTIPGGLWELFIGIWLIVKGFSTSALASDTDIDGTDQPAHASGAREPLADAHLPARLGSQA